MTKPTKPTKTILNADETAAHLGITTDELMTSFYRGLAPGNLGFHKGGVLVWRRTALKKVEVDGDG